MATGIIAFLVSMIVASSGFVYYSYTREPRLFLMPEKKDFFQSRRPFFRQFRDRRARLRGNTRRIPLGAYNDIASQLSRLPVPFINVRRRLAFQTVSAVRSSSSKAR